MGYYSEYYLTYTAEDARLDKEDGLPALEFPHAVVLPVPARASKFQVGRAEHPHHDDPWFETEAQALAAASALATGDLVYAVWQWDDENPVTIYLVYQSIVFEP